MSLKAKLEAVIYAAEEPVTLTQLAALFATDALEWKAAQEAASASAAEQGTAGGESLPLLNAEFNYEQLEQPSVTPAELVAEDTVAEVDRNPEADSAGEAAAEAPSAGDASAEPSATTDAPAPETLETAAEPETDPAPETAADLEAEAKRLARQKDREVRTVLRSLLDELIATYASDDRGIEIKEIAGGYRMATKPECHDAARMFVKSLKPALKLSLPALETLAVIAYKQPVTAPEVNEIRGVDSSGVFGSLLARKLIATAGRKQVIGRPILYKTTKEFLLKFGLNDVSELPSMEEFEKIAQLEFEDMEPVAENEAAEASESLADDEESRPEEIESAEEPVSETAVNPVPAATTPEDTSKEESTAEEANETAATADSNPAPVVEGQETTEPPADTPATEAATTPAEAAPAAPSPLEQAETETVPHD
jgi:segregation and condensation protein B